VSVVQAAANPHRKPLAAIIIEASSSRRAVYTACTLAALFMNYLLGADMAWDTVNYQLYAGFSALNDRFGQDYFAAGPQSYFNPYAYVPFYALVKAGFSSFEISSVLAIIHSAILWLTYELAVCVAPASDRRLSNIYGLYAVALTLVNPILVQQIGSSYADIMTALPVLGGWLLLAHAVRAPGTARVLSAGLLLGIAVALKLTNVVHAIAGVAVLTMLPLVGRSRIRKWLTYLVSLGFGFAIASAPWSYRLLKMFGNPMFPLMNSVFRSPEFTTEPLRHYRFIPDSLANALWRPFSIVDPAPMLQEELTAPDVRYAVLAVLAGFLFLRVMWRRVGRSYIPAAQAELNGDVRVLAGLGCGLAADWILWLSGSGNGRYFLPMASVTAVVIAALVFRLFAARPKVRNYILVSILGIQIAQLCIGANNRWNPVPWGRQWLEVEVPEKLATEPSLYLTVGVQSNSFLAPYLASGSGMVNFSGGYALEPDGANGTRIIGLMQKYKSHVRVLWRPSQLEQDDNLKPNHLSVDDPLASFGLRVDNSDCARIIVHGLPPEPEFTIQSSTRTEPIRQKLSNTSYLTSCNVVQDSIVRSNETARRGQVDLVFDRLEDACPLLFQPRRLRTEHTGESWRRLYINTDLVAMISHGTLKFLNPVRGGKPTYLGLESEWEKAPLRLTCGRRDGHFFARELDLGEER
jgi:hypothetical protein